MNIYRCLNCGYTFEVSVDDIENIKEVMGNFTPICDNCGSDMIIIEED